MTTINLSIPPRLQSRKFWTMVLCYAIVLGHQLLGVDVSSQLQQIMAATGPAYIVAQGFVDAMGKPPAQQG